ncbi:MAG: flagellar basal body rod protein FlgB [Myxococcota bacterium]
MRLFDATTATLERALDVRLTRQGVLAHNVANVDTPGFTPRDVNVTTQVQTAAAGGLGLDATQGAHLGAEGSSGSRPAVTTEEVPGARRLDGNAVDVDRVMATLAENAMQYSAAARTVSRKLAILRYVASDGNG